MGMILDACIRLKAIADKKIKWCTLKLHESCLVEFQVNGLYRTSANAYLEDRFCLLFGLVRLSSYQLYAS